MRTTANTRRVHATGLCTIVMVSSAARHSLDVAIAIDELESSSFRIRSLARRRQRSLPQTTPGDCGSVMAPAL